MTSSSSPVGGDSGLGQAADNNCAALLDQALLGSTGRAVLMSGSRQEALLDNPRSQGQLATHTRRGAGTRNEGQPNTKQSPLNIRAANTGSYPASKGSYTALSAAPLARGTNTSWSCFPNQSGAQNPLLSSSRQTTPRAQTVENKTQIAAPASAIAKERKAMLETVDGLLDTALGKGQYTKPTDHRGYVALIAKASRKLGKSKAGDEFKSKIELAGQPFRLNFGLSRTEGGKRVALNSNVGGALGPLYQAEQNKFATEFKSTTSTGRRNTSAAATTPPPSLVPATPSTSTRSSGQASIQDVTNRTSTIA